MGENGIACVPKSAQDLLTEFQQTGSQQPFEEIARRYAGMVYNVALRVTRDGHDAEDATQATFLTLAVHAKTAGKIRYLGPWLKKVSHRLALDIRRSKKRRTAREQRHAANGNGNGNGDGFEPPASNQLQTDELRLILREEIDKLPAKYRLPLILYYFGGLSPEEMSKELQCNTSTLGVRLHRGRKMLADSLGTRGINMNAVVVAAALSGVVDNFIRDNLVHACSHAAVHVASGRFVADATVSAKVIALMHTATAALRWSKLKIAMSVALLLAGTFAGATEVLQRYDVLDAGLIKNLNPMRLIRPLLDRMFQIPRFSIQTSAPDSKLSPVDPTFLADATAVQLPYYAYPTGDALTFRPYLNDGLPDWGRFPMAQSVSVESIRQMASQYQQPLTLAIGPIAPQVLPIPASTNAQSSTFSLSAALPFQPAVSSHAAAPVIALASPTSGNNTPIVVDRLSGTSASNPGRYTFSQGVLDLPQLVVGDVAQGHFNQTGGLVKTPQVVIGNRKGSQGDYNISAGSLIASNIVVGKAGHGVITQTGGTVIASGATPGTLTLGALRGSEAEYILHGGTVYADTFNVGSLGTGVVTQDGGTASASVVQLGAGATGQGSWNISGGGVQTVSPTEPSIVTAALQNITVSPAPPPSAIIAVGGAGSGTIVLQQPSNSKPVIGEQPGTQGTNLVVRSNEGGTGTVKGYGQIAMTGQLILNGRIIADGNGAPHTLDISTASRVTNTIDNPAVGGTNGYFARNGGSLKLPKINVTGDYYYTWGEDVHDDAIDLVNSVRFRPGVGNEDGTIDITLLDPRSHSVPALPGNRSAVGLWSLDSTVDLSDINLLVRYDDALTSDLHLSEADLGLWVYENNAWQSVTDYVGIDPARHLIWGLADGNPTYFAAAPLSAAPAGLVATIVPEPSMIALGLLGAGTILMRRRRRAD